MRVYSVEPDGKFRAFMPTPFQVEHEEAVLEDWLEANPDAILEDGKLFMIGRQVNTNLGSTIDLLALDRNGNLVVIELKRDRTPRDTLAQALEYASFAEQLDARQIEKIFQSYEDVERELAECHREYFGIGPEEALSFNKDQRIVIVGQRVTSEIRQTAAFLRSKGIRVTCVEFSFFQTDAGTRLLSQEIVVGHELPTPEHVPLTPRRSVSREEFLRSVDENGKAVFTKILDFASQKSMPIRWATKGFSLNVDFNGIPVVVCYGYPPNCVFKQSLYTGRVGAGGFAAKTLVSDDEIRDLWKNAEATGLFRPGGGEMKCSIDRPFSQEEIRNILSWIEDVAGTLIRCGLKQGKEVTTSPEH